MARLRSSAFTLTILVLVGLLGLLWGVTSSIANPARQRTKVMRGAEARAYVANLRAVDRNYRLMMEAAEADLLSRGFVPSADGIVVVELSTEPESAGLVGKLLDQFSLRVNAQTVNKSDGRAIWSSWNDGDNRTWEGNIFGESYGHNARGSMNAQYHIETGEWVPSTYWHQQTGASQPPGSGIITNYHGGKCNSGDLMRHWVQHGGTKYSPACAASAAGCRLAGPAFWQCLGASCLTAATTGIIEDITAWFRECSSGCTWRQISPGIWQCN